MRGFSNIIIVTFIHLLREGIHILPGYLNIIAATLITYIVLYKSTN